MLCLKNKPFGVLLGRISAMLRNCSRPPLAWRSDERFRAGLRGRMGCWNSWRWVSCSFVGFGPPTCGPRPVAPPRWGGGGGSRAVVRVILLHTIYFYTYLFILGLFNFMAPHSDIRCARTCYSPWSTTLDGNRHGYCGAGCVLTARRGWFVVWVWG
jgi:hypothetical protein